MRRGLKGFCLGSSHESDMKNEVHDDDGDDGDGNDDDDFDDDDFYDEDGHGDESSQEQLLMMLNHLKQKMYQNVVDMVDIYFALTFPRKLAFPNKTPNILWPFTPKHATFL